MLFSFIRVQMQVIPSVYGMCVKIWAETMYLKGYMTEAICNRFFVPAGKDAAQRAAYITETYPGKILQSWEQVLDMKRHPGIAIKISQNALNWDLLVSTVQRAEGQGMSVLEAIAANDDVLREQKWTDDAIEVFTTVVLCFWDMNRDSR